MENTTLGRGSTVPYYYDGMSDDVADIQKTAVISELDSSRNIKEHLDFSRNLNKMIDLMHEKIKTATYIELKSFMNELDNSEKSLENIKGVWSALHTMEATARTVCSTSMGDNNQNGYIDHMDQFYAESGTIKAEFLKLKDEIQNELEIRYGDKEATTKFLTDEIINGLIHSIVDIIKEENQERENISKEEILEIAKNSDNREIKLLLKKIDLFTNREYIVGDFINQILFAEGTGHLRDLRKTKQSLRGNYNDTFRKTQKDLIVKSGYSFKQLAMFERGILEHTKFTETETVIFFTWLKRSIFDRIYLTNYDNLDKELINIFITNVIDIQAGIWKDEEMDLTAEKYMESVSVLFQIFEKDAYKTKEELINQLDTIYATIK